MSVIQFVVQHAGWFWTALVVALFAAAIGFLANYLAEKPNPEELIIDITPEDVP